MPRRWQLAPIAALTLACGASVESTTTTTSTTSGTGGTGGTGGTAGTGGDGCGHVDVAVDFGDARVFDALCFGSWGAEESASAVGYLLEGGPYPGVQRLVVKGCVGSAQGQEGLELSAEDAAGSGTYTAGLATYVDTTGVAWGTSGDPFELTVTDFEPPGGHVRGSFAATVTHGGDAAHDLAGTFDVCRVTDMLVP